MDGCPIQLLILVPAWQVAFSGAGFTGVERIGRIHTACQRGGKVREGGNVNVGVLV